MAPTIHITQKPVVLEGYQAVLKPSKFGYTLGTVFDEKTIQGLEQERAEVLEWAKSKLKNPNRSTLKPEPWEQVADDKYKVKFAWNDDNRPTIVDTEGTLITDERVPLYNGSTVKLAYRQKPYILKDGVTYGTSLKLVGVQVITVNNSASVDSGDLDETEVAALFGQTKGYKASEPNITPFPKDETEEDF